LRQAFLQALAGSEALLTTAGNQVLGEAIHFRKPVLALPEDEVLEQELNALALERSGCGRSCPMRGFDAETWRRFESELPELRRGIARFMDRHPRYDGLSATLHLVRRMLRGSARLAPARRSVGQPALGRA
jgi:UDP:flavonoid glycosyltransferase YjiC (YdhE family)